MILQCYAIFLRSKLRAVVNKSKKIENILIEKTILVIPALSLIRFRF